MKRTSAFILSLLVVATIFAAERLDLKDITAGKYSARHLPALTPLQDGESYAQISQDRKRIERYAFRTGKATGTLFDVENTVGETITSFDAYKMSPNGKKMLIQTQTKRIYRHSFTATYYIYDITTRRLEKLSEGGPQQSPVWSSDGNLIAFVRDNNIFIIKLLYDNAETQVTKDGRRNEIINGIPDWVNEEEFGFNTALTFNADGTMLTWIRYDETQVPVYQLQMFKGSKPEMEQNRLYPGVYEYKYPKAGERNAKVSLHSYDVQSRQTRKLDVPLPDDGYIPRLKATKNADRVVVYTLNRHQDELSIYAVNPRSTVSKLLLKEKADKYVKESVLDDIQIADNHILIPSDRDGYMQLYLYNINGNLLKKMTTGKYDVTDVYGFDEQTGNVYYQAAGRNPMNREVYVTARNGKTTCLTPQEGWNSAVFSTTMRYFIHQSSTMNTPYQFDICTSAGKKLLTLEDNSKLKAKLPADMPEKELFTFTTSEGVTLNGVMIKPEGFDATRKYPVIMWQYGGPGSQQVMNSWSMGSVGQGCMFDIYLAQRGFIVVCVDGRGTGGRGSDFEKATYLTLGDKEAKDQVEAALYLSSLPYVDANNIGIWGWSYGGFNTLMSMSEGRGVFRAGVAVAPPTDWRFYDTVYTERYMRTPQENPQGYGDNPIARADQLQGELLICHGMADDNVHPQNTYEYAEALVQADKHFYMNMYTNRNHSIYGGNTRNHLLRQIANFFETNLK